MLDEGTAPWGVLVERVEVKDVRVPEQLQRAMAAEAEAAREARAKVIAAEGEHKASRALRHAAEVMEQSPAAVQLRYLQTLSNISGNKYQRISSLLSHQFYHCSGEQQHRHLPGPHRYFITFRGQGEGGG